VRSHTAVRRQAPTEDVELRDLLDRILDKGLYLGSANMLLLGETDLSTSRDHFTLSSAETGDGLPAAAKPSPMKPRRTMSHRRKRSQS
jgi:hypothetical protein